MDYLEGLNASQKTKVKGLIQEVCDLHLSSTRTIAASLRELKDSLSEDNWKAFLTADLLPFGKRTINDYLFAHTFLSGHYSKGIPDSVLNRTSIRTIVMMVSNIGSFPFTEFCDRMRDGEIIRQKDVLEALGKGKEKETKESPKSTIRQLEEEKEELQIEIQRISSKLVEAIDEATYYKTHLRALESAHKLDRHEYESQDTRVKKRYQKLLETHVVEKVLEKVWLLVPDVLLVRLITYYRSIIGLQYLFTPILTLS